jgi:ABC-2 type transport system permease protein
MWQLLQIELFKIFKRPRTYISFVAIAVIVIIIQLAMKVDGASYIEFTTSNISDTLEIPMQKILNGYLVCFVILNTLLIQVPLLIALVAGDIIAGEANMGTLRLLMTKPFSRTQLMLVKFATSVLYTVILLIWMAVLALGLSVLLFGVNDMIILRSEVIEQIQQSDFLWRYFAAFGYAAVALTTVAALAFLFSIFADNSIGPIVTTMSVVIVFTILSEMNIPIYDTTIKPYLFTTHMVAWKGFFYLKTDNGGHSIKGSIENLPAIWRSMMVLLAYIIVFVSAAIIIFKRKDILS